MMGSNFSPVRPESIGGFLKLAERLAGREIGEAEFDTAVKGLPPITHEQLKTLADYSYSLAPRNPRLGWAAAWVGEVSAVSQTDDLLLQAKAAWHLGRAANAYYRPEMAVEAIDRARMGFERLNEADWLAACDWQENVLAWARPNLQDALEAVTAAFHILSSPDSSLGHFEYECRLTLAYVQTLCGRYEDAYDNLDRCAEHFRSQGNQINIIRSREIRGDALYRQSKYDEAITVLEENVSIAKAENTPVEEAFNLGRLAHVYFKRVSYGEAEKAALSAIRLFETLDLPFGEGYWLAGLASIYISQGRLTKAGEALAKSREILGKNGFEAPLASTLIDLGWLETYRANYENGLEALSQAEHYCRAVGNQYMLGVCLMHLGELHLEMGRYQLALQNLEESVENFETLGVSGRIAECCLRLARCWRSVGGHKKALEALDRVEDNARKAKQGNIFPYLHLRRAETRYLQGKRPEMVESLAKALDTARDLDDRTGMGLSHRLLGEAYLDIGLLEKAAENLDTAEKIFIELDLVVEQAACKVSWGNYYRQKGENKTAQRVWEAAVEMAQHIAPDIVWQARTGLALLAEDSGDDQAALKHYRLGVRALTRLRQDIWQPVLAGYFLKRLIAALENAIRLAASLDSAADVLDFVEAVKAQAVTNQFRQPGLPEEAQSEKASDALSNLVAEIRWRQERFRGMANEGGWLRSDYQKMRRELYEMVERYDSLRNRLERKYKSVHHKLAAESHGFNLDSFREGVNVLHGESWTALNYYLLDNSVYCAVITSESCRVLDLGFPGGARYIFEELDNILAGGRWPEEYLEEIGRWLLPEAIMENLAEDRVLYIAPHRQLNHLPWSALWVDGERLAGCSMPVIVPSLQSAAALMARPERKKTANGGLILAVSEFGPRYEPLPYVVKEMEALLSLSPGSQRMLDQEAVWPALQAVASGEGLKTYRFLHIASHAFADTVSGRLSSLALFDRDVWLDELRELAPFPALVTLSACSGGKGKLYEGDEQVGLSTTFLAAGARQVVASLWPIKDEEAAWLMKRFYRFLLGGEPAGRALALAQRAAAQEGKEITHWAGFRCTGLPE